MKFDTLARAKLSIWAEEQGIGPSEIARRMTTPGHTVLQSSVSRWLKGESRPEPQYRPVLEHLAGVPESDWLTPAERATIKAVLEKDPAA